MRYVLALVIALLAFPAHAEWALIVNGKVADIAASKFAVSPEWSWVDIATVNPKPKHGWAYDGAIFTGPPAPAAVTVISYEAFVARFTVTEFDNATDFVEEADTTTGKPKRRALKQGMARVYAKGAVNLLDAKTVAFMDALVAGGIITSQRKTEILTP